MSNWEKQKNQHCYTDSDRLEVVEKYLQGTGLDELHEEYGVSKDSIKRWAKKNRLGFLAEKEDGVLPDGHLIKGTSILYKDGKETLTWVKTNQDAEQMMAALERAVDNLSQDIPPQKNIPAPKHTKADLCSTYIITDYHFGQLSSLMEVGEEYNMEIAENLLMDWFGAAITGAPDSHTAILAQMGDFLHTDALDALTPTGKNLLDASERYGPIVDVVVVVLRRIINMLLEKHEHVHVILAEGNHDIGGSCWLRSAFAQLYRDEPRVSVDRTHLPFYGFEWGSTAIFFHHGHKVKMGQLADTLTAMFPEMVGNTKYRYAHVGHYHHKKLLESRVMVVEQHSTLAPKDAYSARGGYLSQRSSNIITYHKKYGELARLTLTPEMVSK